MTQITWQSISLNGFGPFAQGIRVEFRPGLNLLLAPNEYGKSTLIAGLLAVLFGLPKVSDPGKFGVLRFRSWEGGEVFNGEVVFQADHDLYRIQRRFTEHQVVISQRRQETWQNLDTYEHNPLAQKGSGRYEQFLTRMFGMDTVEAFAATFYIQQPLPEGERLAEQVESLLSGSGGHFQRGLGLLTEELAAITKDLKQYGFERGKIKDRPLEEMTLTIAALEQQINDSRQTVMELQATLQALGELDEALNQVKKDYLGKKQLQEAWGEGRSLHSKYREAVTKQLELRDSMAEVEALDRQIAAAQQTIDQDYRVFWAAPADFPAALDDLLAGEREEQAQAVALQTLAADLQEAEAALATIEEELQQLAAFKDNPHLLADWQRYLDIDRQRDELAAALAGYRRELAAVEQELAETYAAFVDLTPAQKEELAEYKLRQLRLETLVSERERAWQDGQDTMAAYEKLGEDFQREYGSLVEVDPADLANKMALLRELQMVDAADGAATSTVATVALWLFTAALGAGGGWLLRGFTGVVLGALAGFLFGWVAHKLWRRLGPVGARNQRRQEINAAIEAIHGRWGTDLQMLNAFELEAVLAKRQRLPAEQEKLREWAAKVRQLDMGALTRDREEARQQLARWQALLAGPVAAFGEETPAAFQAFRELQERQRTLKARIQAKLYGEPADPEQVAPAGVKDQLAIYEEQLTRLAGRVAPYELHSSPARVEADSLRYQKLREERRAVEDREHHLLAAREKQKERRAAVATATAALRNRLGEFLAPWFDDGARTKTAWENYQQARQQLRELQSQYDGLLAGAQVGNRAELGEKAIAAANEAQLLLGQLSALTERHPGLPFLSADRDWQAREQDYRQLQEEIGQLAAQEEELKERERELGRRLAALEGQEPFNLAQGELALLELREARAALAWEAQALGIAHRELKEAGADFNQSHLGRLAEQATQYLQKLTGRPRQIAIGEDYHLALWADGENRQINQFSQGTKDQFFLALRLAVGDLLAHEIRLPFIFDDPFLNYDDRRLQEIKVLLQKLARERQILLLSHRQDLADWGHPVTVTKG